MSRDAFGPNLRRVRVHRGIALERIVVSTQIPQDLLEGLEQNDFSRWPTGIYARAYVRQYAEAIGLDPDSVVNDFCRWFPHGDRRAERLLREQAAIVGHELVWRDEPSLGRRGSDAAPSAPVEAYPVPGASDVVGPPRVVPDRS